MQAATLFDVRFAEVLRQYLVDNSKWSKISLPRASSLDGLIELLLFFGYEGHCRELVSRIAADAEDIGGTKLCRRYLDSWDLLKKAIANVCYILTKVDQGDLLFVLAGAFF
jgi:hypothetical protein